MRSPWFRSLTASLALVFGLCFTVYGQSQIAIGTIADLQKIGNDAAYPLNGYYVLTQDIDATATAAWNSGAGFDPIGDSAYPFTGIINGQGHVITGLTIKRPVEQYVGLLGYLLTPGEVKNLGIKRSSVSGQSYVGGLVGENSGTLTDCFAEGAVSGGAYTGALVGRNGGTMSNCYATGAVSGYDYSIGGLVGANYGTVENCYAAGAVSGSGGDFAEVYDTGGLAGYNSGIVTNCYAAGVVSGQYDTGGLVGLSAGTVQGSFWDVETSGQTASSGGTGLTTAQMQTRSTYTDAGWDFTAVWDMQDGITLPYHRGALFAGGAFTVSATGLHGSVSISPSGGSYAGGTLVSLRATPDTGYAFAGWQGPGIPDDHALLANPLPAMVTDSAVYGAVFLTEGPIPIDSIETLQRIGRDAAYPLQWDYVITRDIDASATATWNSGTGFIPIGDYYYWVQAAFTGTLDGQGHVISGLTINRPYEPEIYYYYGISIGLFGAIGEGGEVRNLGIEEAELSSMGYLVGGLAGMNSGTVANCHVQGQITGALVIGGLVGGNEGIVTGSYAIGAVSGIAYTGGLVGYNLGTLTSCFATGPVSASGEGEGEWEYESVAGGLAGFDEGIVTNCYAAGPVSATGLTYTYAGGLLGVSAGMVTNCYATGAVSALFSGSGEGEVGYESMAGGLVGYLGSGAVEASFWDMETSGQSTSAGGTGLTTAQMRQQDIYTEAGWDFVNVWAMEPGGYPYLLMLGVPPSEGEGESSTVPDLDGDGMPNAYEALYPEALDPEVDDAALDADGDSLSNLAEYLLGSSPVDLLDPVPVMYVDGVSGSDGSGTGTMGNPYRTIQHAIDSANMPSSPVRIVINPGTYPEDVALAPNITLAKSSGEVKIQGTLTGAANCAVEGIAIEAVSAVTPLMLMADVAMTLKDVILDGAAFHPAIGLEITGSAPKDGVLEHVTFSSFGVCLRIRGAIPKVRRCIFENFTNSGIYIEESEEKDGDTGGLGDMTSAESGWNTFRDYDTAPFAVINNSGGNLKMQNNDWGVYSYDEIKTRVKMEDGSDVEPEDVEPFAEKNAGILAGSIYCAVVDAKSQKRLTAASVQLIGSAYAAVTENENGVYAFPAVASGTYSLSVLASTYVTATAPVTVDNGAQAAVTVALSTPNTNPPDDGHDDDGNNNSGQDDEDDPIEGEGETEIIVPISMKFLNCGGFGDSGASWAGDGLALLAALGVLMMRRRCGALDGPIARANRRRPWPSRSR